MSEAKNKKFNLKISRRIDEVHVQMEQAKRLPDSHERREKMLQLREKLRILERMVKV